MKIDVKKTFKGWKILDSYENYPQIVDDRETLNFSEYSTAIFDMIEDLILHNYGKTKPHSDPDTVVEMEFSKDYKTLFSQVFYKGKPISFEEYKREECKDLYGVVETEVDMTFRDETC